MVVLYKTGFFDEVHDFQSFIIKNINILGNYQVISEQTLVSGKEVGIIDILAIDNVEKRLTIIELKNTKTSDKNIWQPIRYYDLIQRSEESLNRLLIDNGFEPNEINKNPKVLMVVPECSNQLIRSLSYFEHIDCQVIEIKRKNKKNTIDVTKKTFYPSSITHKEDLSEIKNKKYVDWNINEYIKSGINKQKVDLCVKIVNMVSLVFKVKGYKFDVFYTQNKITISKDGKVFMNLFVSQGRNKHQLKIDFVCKNQPNKNDFLYSVGVEKYKYDNNKVKLTIFDLIDKELFLRYF